MKFWTSQKTFIQQDDLLCDSIRKTLLRCNLPISLLDDDAGDWLPVVKSGLFVSKRDEEAYWMDGKDTLGIECIVCIANSYYCPGMLTLYKVIRSLFDPVKEVDYVLFKE